MLTRLVSAATPKAASQSAPVRRLGKPPSRPHFESHSGLRPEVNSSLAGQHNETVPLAAQGPRFDFARVNLNQIQRKTTVSSPNDASEQEADRVAYQAMRTTTPSLTGLAPVRIRQYAGEKTAIQNASTRAGGHGRTPDTRLDTGEAIQAASRSGMPMPRELASFFQPRFGYDFSKVRLHTDGEAADGARSVQARAYTAGRDIVFGAGEYAPHTNPGKQLLAHELTHVVQQNLTPSGQPDVLMRAPTPTPSPLEQLSDADKQKLKFDTDTVTNPPDLSLFFGLAGTPVTATNVDADFDLEVPAVEAVKDDAVKKDLRQGLRLYALSAFDLLPGTDSKAHSKRLNLVHIEALNLAKFKGPVGSYRFTCIGSETKGVIKVKILIEAIDAPAKGMADPAAAAGIEARKAVPYGLKQDASVDGPLWQRILRSLGSIDESLIMRIRDITFEVSPAQAGADGEAAAFDFHFKAKDTGPWTKKIILYQKGIHASDVDFATLLAHEIGHAIDFAPSEKPGGKIPKGEAHNLPKFLEAAKKDGGRSKAITQYGTTNPLEFFAENLSLFVQQPDTFRTLRPNIYAYFVQYEWEAVKDPKLNSASTVWSTAPKPAP